jgi:hypothetical protein
MDEDKNSTCEVTVTQPETALPKLGLNKETLRQLKVGTGLSMRDLHRVNGGWGGGSKACLNV